MNLLRELLSKAPVQESVDDITNGGETYVQLPTDSKKKKKKKGAPTSDKAENSLINTIWHYNNADAT
jgi:hypothetical protein